MLISVLCIVHATASHAFANNVPGPLAFVSMFSLVFLLVALTFAGGGYTVKKRLNEAKHPDAGIRFILNTLEFVAGIVFFFVGIMTSYFGVPVLSIYTIGRGVNMLQWAEAAKKEGAKPAHLEGVNAKRLLFAGVTLILSTLIIFCYSMANVKDMAGFTDAYKHHQVRILNEEAKITLNTAQQYFRENPEAKMVTCEDLVKSGYITLHDDISCFSDLTPTSGCIRMTAPKKWKLTNPVAVITFSGELTPAKK